MKLSNKARTGLCLFILNVILALQISAASGDVDPTFGTGGKVVLSLPGGTAYSGVREFPDGKLLVFGGTTRIMTRRLNTDGSVDKSYGGGWGGLTMYGIPANPYVLGTPHDVEVLPDGRVIVVGSYRVVPNDGTSRAAMWRFDANGILDQSFGTNGRLPLASTPGSALAVEERAGKLFVMFTRTGGAYLSRRSSSGAIDLAFGNFGMVQLSSSTATAPSDLNVSQSDGRIYVIRVGSLKRYSYNGTADTSFGLFGSAQKPVYKNTCSNTEYAVSYSFTRTNFSPDGKLVVGGFTSEPAAQPGFTSSVAGVSRHNSNGLIDAAFNGGEIVCAGLFNAPIYSTGLVQANKEIIFAHGAPASSDPAVQRLNIDGSQDAAYAQIYDFGLVDSLLQRFDEKLIILFPREIQRRQR